MLASQLSLLMKTPRLKCSIICTAHPGSDIFTLVLPVTYIALSHSVELLASFSIMPSCYPAIRRQATSSEVRKSNAEDDTLQVEGWLLYSDYCQ